MGGKASGPNESISISLAADWIARQMKPEIIRAIAGVEARGWKTIDLEFGKGSLEISVPPHCEILSMKDVRLLADPKGAVEKALSSPIGGSTLEEIIKKKAKPAAEVSVSVTVSDITRPVPYKGEAGILIPLLKKLESTGIRKQNIKIIVGTGTHRPSTKAEKREILGDEVLGNFPVLDHNCEQPDCLTYIGKTRRNTDVYVNSAFYSADIRIVTGLVESHFMAGVSGGRKGVCPALVDQRTIEKFHSPEFLESPRADNLILAGNPCHEEALDVARTIGVDFIINVTLDKNMRPTGIFAGHLEEAHKQAYSFMKDYTTIPVRQEYDIVLTHGGYAGRDHYQAAKAGCAALPAVKKGGAIIIAADNRDPEPVGGREYRNLIRQLKILGSEGYVNLLKNPEWTFTRDQWQPEVWARILRKIGEKGLFYCAPQIPAEDFSSLPGRSGHDFIETNRSLSVRDAAQVMVQNVLLWMLFQHQKNGRRPSIAVLREGPYGIPQKQKTR